LKWLIKITIYRIEMSKDGVDPNYPVAAETIGVNFAHKHGIEGRDAAALSKLRALKNTANTNAAEASQYEFLLTDALDTVDSSAEDHRKTVAEVGEYMKRKKKK